MFQKRFFRYCGIDPKSFKKSNPQVRAESERARGALVALSNETTTSLRLTRSMAGAMTLGILSQVREAAICDS
jgi:hypothetical protein